MGNRINMGMEKLLSMGGFIQEYAEDKIYESFSPSAANRLEKYCDTGEYIWQIGETIEQALQSIQKYANIRGLYMNEDESIYGPPDKTFMEWLVEQSVRCKKEKLKSMEPSFWIQWDMKRNMKYEKEDVAIECIRGESVVIFLWNPSKSENVAGRNC